MKTYIIRAMQSDDKKCLVCTVSYKHMFSYVS